MPSVFKASPGGNPLSALQVLLEKQEGVGSLEEGLTEDLIRMDKPAECARCRTDFLSSSAFVGVELENAFNSEGRRAGFVGLWLSQVSAKAT